MVAMEKVTDVPKRMLASDFDGTLYFMNAKEKVHPEDVTAIREFQEKGNLFGLCTGRSLQGILLVLEEDIQFDFMILASGALILDKEKKVIRKKCISYELLVDIYEKYTNHVWIVIQANDTVYNIGMEHPLQITINELGEMRGSDIYGLSFGTETPNEAERIAREINDHYGDVLSAFQNVCNVDIVAKGCSKGVAFDFVKEYFHADITGAIGDSYNDLPMLQMAEVPFTFPYAPESMKEYVGEKNIVESVAQALERLSNVKRSDY